MSEWTTYKLGEISDDIAMGPFGSNLKVDNFISEGVPVIRGMNLHEGGFNKSTFAFVSEEKANSLKRCLAYPDDLVFTHRGTLGQVGIIPNIGFEKYLVSQSQMRLSVNKAKLNPRYLYYFFKSPLGQKELLRNSSQVGVPAIANPTKSLKEVEITIPNLGLQSEIVHILSSLDDKIELNLQMNQTLEGMAQAIFKEWCCAEPGNIPNGWAVKKLDELAEVTSSKRIFMEEYVKIGIPFYRGKEVTQLSKGEEISTELFITEEKYGDIKLKFGVPIIGDILITSVGTIGSVWLVDNNNPFYFKDGNVTWVKNYKTNITGEFVFQWLQTKGAMDQIKSLTIGSTQQALTISALKNLNILIPDINIVSQIMPQLRDINSKRISNLSQTRTLTQIRDSLLPKLITGKIEIQA